MTEEKDIKSTMFEMVNCEEFRKLFQAVAMAVLGDEPMTPGAFQKPIIGQTLEIRCHVMLWSLAAWLDVCRQIDGQSIDSVLTTMIVSLNYALNSLDIGNGPKIWAKGLHMEPANDTQH